MVSYFFLTVRRWMGGERRGDGWRRGRRRENVELTRFLLPFFFPFLQLVKKFQIPSFVLQG